MEVQLINKSVIMISISLYNKHLTGIEPKLLGWTCKEKQWIKISTSKF